MKWLNQTMRELHWRDPHILTHLISRDEMSTDGAGCSAHKNSSASFSRSVGASVSPSLISWHMFWYLNNLFNTLIASRVLHDIKVNTASIRGRTFAFSREIYWLPLKIILRIWESLERHLHFSVSLMRCKRWNTTKGPKICDDKSWESCVLSYNKAFVFVLASFGSWMRRCYLRCEEVKKKKLELIKIQLRKRESMRGFCFWDIDDILLMCFPSIFIQDTIYNI